MPGLSVLLDAADKRKRQTGADASQAERDWVANMRAASSRGKKHAQLMELDEEARAEQRRLDKNVHTTSVAHLMRMPHWMLACG